MKLFCAYFFFSLLFQPHKQKNKKNPNRAQDGPGDGPGKRGEKEREKQREKKGAALPLSILLSLKQQQQLTTTSFFPSFFLLLLQDCGLLEEVSSWVASATQLPFWAKLTPNVTSIPEAGRAALKGGARGLAAINTINSISGVDLDTLRPQPCVEGATTPGGYSGPAVKPIALAKVAALASMIKRKGREV